MRKPLTSPDHLLPSFMIMGERKCGTSSLYRYLCTHPTILPPKEKEPRLFILPEWLIPLQVNKYIRLFPSAAHEDEVVSKWVKFKDDFRVTTTSFSKKRLKDVNYITGEASAPTFYQGKPETVKAYLPDLKLILMLRNPVDRAYSHFLMYQRFKKEKRWRYRFRSDDFLSVIEKEIQQTDNGKKTDIVGPGKYVAHLKHWVATFGKENIFIIRTEDMKNIALANQIMNDLCTFLSIPIHDFSAELKQQYNVAPKKNTIPEAAKDVLEKYYAPSVKELENYLRRDFNWF